MIVYQGQAMITRIWQVHGQSAPLILEPRVETEFPILKGTESRGFVGCMSWKEFNTRAYVTLGRGRLP